MIDFKKEMRDYYEGLTASEQVAFKTYIEPYNRIDIAGKYDKSQWTYFAIQKLGNSNIIQYKNLLLNDNARKDVCLLVDDYNEKEHRKRLDKEYNNFMDQLIWNNEPSHSSIKQPYHSHDEEATAELVRIKRINLDWFPKPSDGAAATNEIIEIKDIPFTVLNLPRLQQRELGVFKTALTTNFKPDMVRIRTKRGEIPLTKTQILQSLVDNRLMDETDEQIEELMEIMWDLSPSIDFNCFSMPLYRADYTTKYKDLLGSITFTQQPKTQPKK